MAARISHRTYFASRFPPLVLTTNNQQKLQKETPQ